MYNPRTPSLCTVCRRQSNGPLKWDFPVVCSRTLIVSNLRLVSHAPICPRNGSSRMPHGQLGHPREDTRDKALVTVSRIDRKVLDFLCRNSMLNGACGSLRHRAQGSGGSALHSRVKVLVLYRNKREWRYHGTGVSKKSGRSFVGDSPKCLSCMYKSHRAPQRDRAADGVTSWISSLTQPSSARSRDELKQSRH